MRKGVLNTESRPQNKPFIQNDKYTVTYQYTLLSNFFFKKSDMYSICMSQLDKIPKKTYINILNVQ